MPGTSPHPTSSRRSRRPLAVAALIAVCLPFGGAGAEPGFFSLTSPQHLSVMQWSHLLQWQPSPNATEYFVEIVVADVNDWNSPYQLKTGGLTRWGHSPDSLDIMQGKMIEWRVRACDASGSCRLNNGTDWDAFIPLALATPLAPANNATAPSRAPDFTWQMRTGASVYRLIVNGSMRGYVGSGNCNQGAQTCTFSGGSNLPGNSALWYVQACYLAPGVRSLTVCGEPLPSTPPPSNVWTVNLPATRD